MRCVVDPIDYLPAAAPRKTLLGWLSLLAKVLATTTAAVAVWWMTRRIIATDSDASGVLLPLLMMALVIGAFAWQEIRWCRPRRRLLGLFDPILAGRMPMDSLNEVGGGIAPIAAAARGLLHRARSCDRKVAELNSEMSQRVANRTDALERVIGSLRQQAIRDPLTGLFNRRALDELLPRLIDHCQTRGADLSLMMMDLDCFKQLNDQLGHAAGDEMLKTIAQLIRSSLARNQDVAFRCGGDEFVVVLPGCPPQPARELAEHLRTLVGSIARSVKSNPRPALSVGLCSLSELPSPVAADLLRYADSRLYDVKRTRSASKSAA